MLCISLKDPLLSTIASKECDIIEWRLDLFKEINFPFLKKLRAQLNRPVIFTLRKKSQGGRFQGSEEERIDLIKRLCDLKPDYLDLEWDTAALEVRKIKIILSYHNFDETPLNLEDILKNMKTAHMYKIACKANSTIDALRMLSLKSHIPLLKICMHEKGEITRILGNIFDSPWTYASIDTRNSVAPGQLTPDELRNTYFYPQTTPSTKIYGLIGSPITPSISHLTHNKVMKELEIQSVYVKMPVEPDELKNFLLWAKKIGVQGLSVTMPLKEKIIPFLDEIDPEAAAIGSVNTLLFQEGKIKGFNTDRYAWDAIETKMKAKGKKIVIVGAGGASRALVYEAKKRGGDVTIINRTLEKAMHLAREFGCKAATLDFSGDYDILINATPESLPISSQSVLSHRVVMDIQTRPKMTKLLEEALNKKCRVVFGYEMFINQAVEQFAIWFNDALERKKIKEIMEIEALIILASKTDHQGINADDPNQKRKKESISSERT